MRDVGVAASIDGVVLANAFVYHQRGEEFRLTMEMCVSNVDSSHQENLDRLLGHYRRRRQKKGKSRGS